MKKNILAFFAFTISLSVNAQVVKLYKGNTLVAEYPASQVDNVEFTKSSTQESESTGNNEGESTGNQENGSHDYVDLGLPSGTLWATCNVGASKPEEYGDFFAWGETTPKNSGSTYGISNYKYYNQKDSTYIDKDGFEITKTIKGYTKYVPKSVSFYGYDSFFDDKIVLESSDDVATSLWGKEWKMATFEQWQELLSNCTWTYCMLNNVYGEKVVGPNGNFIFLPAAGWASDIFGIDGGNGYYWTSTLRDKNYFELDAWYFEFDSTSFYWNGGFCCRAYGRSVRPVRNK